MTGCELYRFGSGETHGAGCCEFGNEHWGSLTQAEIFDYLSDC